MRILHVSHSAQPGGSNEVILSMLRHAPAGTRSWCVFLEDGPSAPAAAALGAPVAVVESGRAREPWRAPGTVRALRGAIRTAQPDLVLAHVAKAHPYAAAAARLEGVPEAWWQQQHLRQDRPLQEVAGRVPAAAVICSAAWTGAEQAARFARTPVETVLLGSELPPDPPAREHRPGPVTLGVVGRLQRWKRVELVLEALPRVVAAVPGTRLQVVGDAWAQLDADYPQALRDRAGELGIADAVDFLGHVPGASERMAELDLLVHAADREPFGLVLVEALARGVPVVGPDAGGPREIVRHGIDGLLVDVSDPGAFADAVVELARDPARRAAMGAAGRERALEQFTAKAMAQRAYGVLGRLAGAA